MSSFLLNISSPLHTSLTHPKLTHKPFDSTSILTTRPNYSYDLATTKRHRHSRPVSIARKEGCTTKVDANQEIVNSLLPDLMPEHVAMIREKDRALLRADRGSLIDVALICRELGIKVLSVHTYSSEQEEGVEFTMNIMKSDLEELSRNDIRVSVIGNRKGIPDSVLEFITQLEEATKNNKSFHIIETVNYTGHFDIIQSCMALAEKVKDGLLQPDEIDDKFFEQELETKFSEVPNPDLVIRTGGPSNFGNFMLWQSAYSEISFVEKDALQFNKTDFIEVLKVYQKRNRRFGGSDKK
ncbi:hypothetical protein R6Q59_025898 [Mikania micrantha]